LEALPDALRSAVVMRDLHELSYQEIAGRLGLPEGTVKSRINRGRAELARQIRKLHAGDRQTRPSRKERRPRTGVYR
jgi:RNA polymerase sigma-70 factor (ECF subfamily)